MSEAPSGIHRAAGITSWQLWCECAPSPCLVQLLSCPAGKPFGAASVSILRGHGISASNSLSEALSSWRLIYSSPSHSLVSYTLLWAQRGVFAVCIYKVSCLQFCMTQAWLRALLAQLTVLLPSIDACAYSKCFRSSTSLSARVNRKNIAFALIITLQLTI